MTDTPINTIPITTVAALNAAIVTAAGETAPGTYKIVLGSVDIELTTALTAINLHAGVTLDIAGHGANLDGKNETTSASYNQRGLFVYSGAVTIENLSIINTSAKGGNAGSGGGGGAGLGGGLYVADDTGNKAAPGNVTLTNVLFAADSATGGSGGVSGGAGGGGGGGLGGNGRRGHGVRTGQHRRDIRSGACGHLGKPGGDGPDDHRPVLIGRDHRWQLWPDRDRDRQAVCRRGWRAVESGLPRRDRWS